MLVAGKDTDGHGIEQAPERTRAEEIFSIVRANSRKSAMDGQSRCSKARSPRWVNRSLRLEIDSELVTKDREQATVEEQRLADELRREPCLR